MSEKWYVVHVTTSFEDTVKRYIFEQMKLDNCPGLISDVLVPTETLEEQLKGGKKKKIEKKFFPEYSIFLLLVLDKVWLFGDSLIVNRLPLNPLKLTVAVKVL